MNSSFATPPTTRAPGLLIATLAMAQMLVGLDYNIVFIALPHIADVGFQQANLQWVVSAYAVIFGGFLLLFGRLTDLLGRRRIFLAGLGLFAAGSLLGSVAQEPLTLLAGRGFQGLGGAALAPSTLALLASNFPEGQQRNRAFGVWGAAGSFGMVAGSILGGVLTDLWGWRSIFVINLPIIFAILVLSSRSIPADPRPGSIRRLDYLGAVLTTGTAISLVMGFTFAAEAGWSAAPTLGCLAGGIILLGILLFVERSADAPILDLARFRNRHLAYGVMSTFLFMASFGAIAYFLTLYFQETRGLSALLSGLVFVIPCLGVLFGTGLGARLSTRRGLRIAMITGLAIGLVACGTFALVITATIPWLLVFGLTFAFSIGQGIVFTTMFATATTGTADADQGIASGLATTGQQLGGAIGLAILISMAAQSGEHSLVVVMLIITGIIAVAMVVAARIPAATAYPAAKTSTPAGPPHQE